MNTYFSVLLFSLGSLELCFGDFQPIHVQFDTSQFQDEEAGPCQALQELNANYWQRERFFQCEALSEPIGGVVTYEITVDTEKLLPEHRELPRDFYLWVLNRQLNLQEIGCATLADFPDNGCDKDFQRAKITFPSKDCMCDKLKFMEFEGDMKIEKCAMLQKTEEAIHTEFISTYAVEFSKPVMRSAAVKVLQQLNGGRKRCRYNMVPCYKE